MIILIYVKHTFLINQNKIQVLALHNLSLLQNENLCVRFIYVSQAQVAYISIVQRFTMHNLLEHIINPRCMREGYGSCSVCLSVYLSVTKLAATYLDYTLKFRCHQAFCADLNICIMWISLKTLCSKVLARFADHLCLLSFWMNSQWTKEAAMASFQEDQHVGLTIGLTTRLIHHWSQQIIEQQRFLACFLCCVAKLLTQARAWSRCILRNIVQLHMRILVATTILQMSILQSKVCTTPCCTRLDSLQAHRGFCTIVLHYIKRPVLTNLHKFVTDIKCCFMVIIML